MTDASPVPSYGEALAAKIAADPALAAQLAPSEPAPAPVPAVVYRGPGGTFTVRRSAGYAAHQSAAILARGPGHYMDHEHVTVPASTAFHE